MTRFFVFEFLTGGGRYVLGESLSLSLRDEGRAMLRSLCEDFAAMPNVEVHTLVDESSATELPQAVFIHSVNSAQQLRRLFRDQIHAADYVFLVAPETDGLLLNFTREAERYAELLSANSSLVDWAGDKTKCLSTLAAEGLPATLTLRIQDVEQLPTEREFWPAVLKPNNGVGSTHVHRCEDRKAATCLIRSLPSISWCVQPWIAGQAASVGLLLGTGCHVMPPFWQQLDGSFAYHGGWRIEDPVLADELSQLASRLAKSIPDSLGYVGIDVVVSNGCPSRISIVEINARLTTSFVGIRRILPYNMADVLVRMARGECVSVGACPPRSVRFDSKGHVSVGNPKS